MRLRVALLLVLLLAPSALAHLQGARPILQRGQRERIMEVEFEGLVANVRLLQSGEPLRQSVRHVIDPPRGVFLVEHREDASDPEDSFWARWEIVRLVEYRDLNVDGRFEPERDTPVKAWRLQHYQWRIAARQSVLVGDVTGTSIVWEGNLTGAPDLRVEAVFAGKDFTDEGAVTRPQDVLLYIDILDLPSRGVGSLYAMEALVTVQGATQLSFHRVQDVPTAALADAPSRRAMLVWGGEALLDGREQRLDATYGAPVEKGGNVSRALLLHIPTTDESMRLVVLSAVEYASENLRAPSAAPGALVAILVLVVLLRRR